MAPRRPPRTQEPPPSGSPPPPSSSSALQFVAPSARRPVATADLIRRLQALHAELKHMEQSDLTARPLAGLADELAAESLRAHKDEGVRLLSACCLAELLRLHAPASPLDDTRLQAVFDLFFDLLPSVTDPRKEYFNLYYELLECLSSSQCTTLATRLSDDRTIVKFFDKIFKSIRPEMSQSVFVCIIEVLHQLIEDSRFLHHDVIATLLDQLTPSQQKASPLAHQMARDLCKATADKLQRYVCQYFSDILVATGRDVLEDADPQQFRTAHELILEIFHVSPEILLNVVPQLEEELKVDSLQMRDLALTSLGEMLIKSGMSFIDTYPNVWKSWCERRNDKVAAIRVQWIKYCAWVSDKHPAVFTELEPMLQFKLLDPDEKVRADAIKAVGAIGTSHPNILSQETLRELSHRCRDKKTLVRADAIEVVAVLFNRSFLSAQIGPDGEIAQPRNMDAFIWLAGDILELLYLNDPETTFLVERHLSAHIMPPIPDDRSRIRRIITVLHHLTDRQHRAFLSLLSRKATTIYEVGGMLQQCQLFNGGIMDTDADTIQRGLNKIIACVASLFPDVKRAQASLHKFAGTNDRRTYHLLRAVMDPMSDFKRIERCSKELMKRLEPQGSAVVETLGALLRRVSLVLIGRTTVESLVNLLGDIRHGREDGSVTQMEPTARQFMRDIAEHFPAVYKTLVQGFVDTILADESQVGVADALEALARYLKTFPGDAPTSVDVVSKLETLAMSDVPEVARDATVVLAQGGHAEACLRVVSASANALDVHSVGLVARLSCLKVAARYAYESAYQSKIPETMKFALKDVLLSNHVEPDDDALDWVEYADLDPVGKAKVLALKLVVTPLTGTPGVSTTTVGGGAEGADTYDMVAADDELARDPTRMELATPALKLLRSLLDNAGEVRKYGPPTLATHKTHLRLTAGICMLKLARRRPLRALMHTTDLHRLALLIQDPVFHVRNAFAVKLCAFLHSAQVPSDYVVMLMLIAHEPDTMLRNQIRAFVTRRAKDKRSIVMKTLTETNGVNNTTTTTDGGESVSAPTLAAAAAAGANASLVENTFGTLLHLVSHHPDFSSDHDDLDLAQGYIQFFLDTVATAENAALLYSIASKLKTVRDQLAVDDGGDTGMRNATTGLTRVGTRGSEKLYMAAELAQMLVHARASSSAWTLQSWPGRVPLSKRLFEHLPSGVASENMKRAYLDAGYVKEKSGHGHGGGGHGYGGGGRPRTPVRRDHTGVAPASALTPTPVRRRGASTPGSATGSAGKRSRARTAFTRGSGTRRNNGRNGDDGDEDQENDDGTDVGSDGSEYGPKTGVARKRRTPTKAARERVITGLGHDTAVNGDADDAVLQPHAPTRRSKRAAANPVVRSMAEDSDSSTADDDVTHQDGDLKTGTRIADATDVDSDHTRRDSDQEPVQGDTTRRRRAPPHRRASPPTKGVSSVHAVSVKAVTDANAVADTVMGDVGVEPAGRSTRSTRSRLQH